MFLTTFPALRKRMGRCAWPMGCIPMAVASTDTAALAEVPSERHPGVPIHHAELWEHCPLLCAVMRGIPVTPRLQEAVMSSR